MTCPASGILIVNHITLYITVIIVGKDWSSSLFAKPQASIKSWHVSLYLGLKTFLS